ncbi:MAG: rod shape-determining protein MreC [Alteromonas naphthalenivorans]
MNQKIKEKRAIYQYILIAVVCFFLVHRAFVKTPGYFEQCLAVISSPFIKLSHTISRPFIATRSFWVDKNKLLHDFERIQKENEILYHELIELESSKIFLEDTHDLRNFQKRYDTHEMLLSQVILKKFGDQHFFLIDAGKQKNVQKNMAVVYKNFLVGKVTHVYPFYSKVALITDPVCQVASYCAKTKTVGIYQGIKDTQSGSLLHVDHLAKLKIGDRVISSGEGLVFPGGFGIGEIQEFKDTGVHYDVKVKPLIDVTQLTHCFVVQKDKV